MRSDGGVDALTDNPVDSSTPLTCGCATVRLQAG